jgi:hypothetical protein
MTKFGTKRRLVFGTGTRSPGAAAFLLGGCGGEGPKGTAATWTAHARSTTTTTPAAAPGDGPGDSAAAQAEAPELAQCMRAHGVKNFPDNIMTISPRGCMRPAGGIDSTSPQYEAAAKACRSLQPAGFRTP